MKYISLFLIYKLKKLVKIWRILIGDLFFRLVKIWSLYKLIVCILGVIVINVLNF